MSKNWIFLRGLTREQRHWGTFVERFQKHFPQDRIFCLDLPGTGHENKIKSPTSIKQICSFLRKRFVELQKQHPAPHWGLFTISLGGMIGLEWCAAYPNDFEILILINSSAGKLNAPWERLRWHSLLKYFAPLALRKMDRYQIEKIIFQITSNSELSEKLINEWVQIAETRPVKTQNMIRQLLAAFQFTLPNRLTVPTLILCSQSDRLVNSQCSQRLAEYYQAKIKINNWAGHDLPLDDPEWVLEEVGNFRDYRPKELIPEN